MSTDRTITIGARSAILAELSDKELLWVLDDVADAEGYATAAEIADQLGLRHDHPTRCVSTRLAWLRRYGAVEQHKDEKHRWTLTNEGAALIDAGLKAAQRRALESLTNEQVLALTTVVTDRFRAASGTAATLMRREWAYGTAAQRFNGYAPPAKRGRRG